MVEAVSTSDPLGNFYETTEHNIPEDGHLYVTLEITELDMFAK
jgi:hypothetical protein